MRQTILALALLASTAIPALAQGMTVAGVEGNWACRALIDGKKAGILTIFAGTYGYASVNFGSKASGTGRAEMASDGATFVDGSLVQGAGIAPVPALQKLLGPRAVGHPPRLPPAAGGRRGPPSAHQEAAVDRDRLPRDVAARR